MTGMDDPFRRIWADAADRLDAELPPYHARPEATSFPVFKHSTVLPISTDVLMDYGVIPDTRPPARISWRTRLRWRWHAWRERMGRKVGGWIAGVDLSEQDW